MTVEFENKEYELTQDAYYSNGNEGYYQAAAEDAEGNVYMVYWEIQRPDADEEDCCDWNEPSRVEFIEAAE